MASGLRPIAADDDGETLAVECAAEEDFWQQLEEMTHPPMAHPEIIIPEVTDDDSVTQDPSECLELAFESTVANALLQLDRQLERGEVLIQRFSQGGVFLESVIERELNVISASEERANKPAADMAKFKELGRWASRKVMARILTRQARNHMDSRWVLKSWIRDGC